MLFLKKKNNYSYKAYIIIIYNYNNKTIWMYNKYYM